MGGTGRVMSSSERRAAGNGRTVNRTSKFVTPEKRAAIYIRDEWTCVYCGRPPRGARFRTHKTAIYPGLALDHVIPRSRGGSNEATNLVTCCDECNRRKADRTVEEWAAQLAMYERARLRGVEARIAAAIAKPIDLDAGKEHIGEKAARPLPQYRREPRERDHGAPF